MHECDTRAYPGRPHSNSNGSMPKVDGSIRLHVRQPSPSPHQRASSSSRRRHSDVIDRDPPPLSLGPETNILRILNIFTRKIEYVHRVESVVSQTAGRGVINSLTHVTTLGIILGKIHANIHVRMHANIHVSRRDRQV
eukprot:GHVR01040682.1.p1 GENE.GHVR01040682.1~~GHVR01040682.1.p1  ORF type:complete len:138 (+),score=32.24 GHVR01040682.1:81-494(+)